MSSDPSPDLDDEPLWTGTEVPLRSVPLTPDSDALLVALVLAPSAFSRNKYFDLFQTKEGAMARRRAQMLRSLLVELTEPWSGPGRSASPPRAEVERTLFPDGSEKLELSVEEFGYRRTAYLTPLEGAALEYVLARAGSGEISLARKKLVLEALARLDPRLPPSGSPQG